MNPVFPGRRMCRWTDDSSPSPCNLIQDGIGREPCRPQGSFSISALDGLVLTLSS